MIRKIFRAGNSMVVALPKEMLDALHLSEGSSVSIEFDADRRNSAIAAPTQEVEGVDAEFARQVAEFIEEYRPALDALAK